MTSISSTNSAALLILQQGTVANASGSAAAHTDLVKIVNGAPTVSSEPAKLQSGLQQPPGSLRSTTLRQSLMQTVAAITCRAMIMGFPRARLRLAALSQQRASPKAATRYRRMTAALLHGWLRLQAPGRSGGPKKS